MDLPAVKTVLSLAACCALGVGAAAPAPRPGAAPAQERGTGAGSGREGAKPKRPRERKADAGREAGPRRGAPRAAGQGGRATAKGGKASIERSLRMLERKALNGQAGPEDFKALELELATATAREGPRGQESGKRMQRTVRDLERRARTASLDADDLALLREQWVESRLDRTLDDLRRVGAQRTLTPEDFAPVGNLLQRRAAAVRTVDPGAQGTRRRLQAEVDRLAQRARTARLGAQDFGQLDRMLGEARLGRALADLERRSLRRSASAADIERVNEAMETMDDAPRDPQVDPGLYAKLRQAIQRLEGRALRGEVSPEEFKELRASLTRRARNAAGK